MGAYALCGSCFFLLAACAISLNWSLIGTSDQRSEAARQVLNSLIFTQL